MNKLETVDSTPIEEENGPKTGYLVTKFIFDRIISLPFLILAAPIIGMAALAIKVYSPGPIFFAHERVGYLGKPIRIWKLRTMHIDAQQLLEAHLEKNTEAKQEWNTYFKLKNDPRIIPVIGHLLRKTSMDELPQLWNVVKGDMSLVGPRPIVKAERQFYGNYLPYYLSVRPGLTGLWQVSGRNDTTYEERVKLDVKYVQSNSIWLDLKILAQTVYTVLARDGSY